MFPVIVTYIIYLQFIYKSNHNIVFFRFHCELLSVLSFKNLVLVGEMKIYM